MSKETDYSFMKSGFDNLDNSREEAMKNANTAVWQGIEDKEKKFFVDEQRLGPYKMWHHQHIFKIKDNGVLMKDIITYIPPFGLIGQIANKIFIKKQLKNIFDYRRKVINERFNQ